MKKVSSLLIIVLLVTSSLFGIFYGGPVEAEIFSANKKINGGPAGEIQSTPVVAATSSGDVYIAWGDRRNDFGDIYFTESHDNGETFNSLEKKINQDVGTWLQSNPDIAVDSTGRIYVVWQDDRNGDSDVWLSYSDDGGSTWPGNWRVDDDAGSTEQQNPSIAIDGSDNVLVAWVDMRFGDGDIRFAMSPDGQTFGASVPVHTEGLTNDQFSPDVVVDLSNGNVYVIWQDWRNDDGTLTDCDIYLARSTDGGSSFTFENMVNTDASGTNQLLPAAAVDQNTGTIYAAWHDERDAANIYHIYDGVSSDAGTSFTNYKVNSDTASVAHQNPWVAVNSTSRVFIVWNDARDGDQDIWLANSTDGASFGTNEKVNDDGTTQIQRNPCIAIGYQDSMHMVWQDYRNAGDADIYYCRAGWVDGPKIISTTPYDGELQVAQDQNIIIQFDEEMDTASVTYTCTPDPGGWVESWNALNDQLTLSHALFATDTVYTFQVTEARNASGANLIPGPVPNPWSFKTTDTIGPVLVQTSPFDGETLVPLKNYVVVRFDEEVDTSTLTFTCNPDPGGWSVTWNEPTNDTAYIDHNTFTEWTGYTFQITGIDDIFGNPFSGASVPNPWAFTTGNNYPPSEPLNLTADFAASPVLYYPVSTTPGGSESGHTTSVANLQDDDTSYEIVSEGTQGIKRLIGASPYRYFDFGNVGGGQASLRMVSWISLGTESFDVGWSTDAATITWLTGAITWTAESSYVWDLTAGGFPGGQLYIHINDETQDNGDNDAGTTGDGIETDLTIDLMTVEKDSPSFTPTSVGAGDQEDDHTLNVAAVQTEGDALYDIVSEGEWGIQRVVDADHTPARYYDFGSLAVNPGDDVTLILDGYISLGSEFFKVGWSGDTQNIYWGSSGVFKRVGAAEEGTDYFDIDALGYESGQLYIHIEDETNDTGDNDLSGDGIETDLSIDYLAVRITPKAIAYDSIRFNWERAYGDASGEFDVVSYEVYRQANGGLWEWYDTVPATGADRYTWVDPLAGYGDTNIYNYTVGTNDTNNMLINAEMVGKFVRPLSSGWNFISCPLALWEASRTGMLGMNGGEYDIVQTYDSSDTSDPWKMWSPSKPDHMNDLIGVGMHHKGGYWVQVTAASTDMMAIGRVCPTVNGPERTIQLYQGWNLVGYPTYTPEQVGAALSGLGVAYKVKAYSAADPANLQLVSDSYVMRTGSAFWIWAESSTTWTVDW